MSDWHGEIATARALGRPARVVPYADLPQHVQALAEAIRHWAEREYEATGKVPYQIVISTSVGEVMVGPTRIVSPQQLAAMVEAPPSPMDDLLTGMRVLTDAYWTRGDIPDDVRGRMRAWIHGANLLLANRYETEVDA